MKLFIKTHPLFTYFFIVFFLSYGGFFLFNGQTILHHQPLQPIRALFLFPIMVIGVAVTSFILTAFTKGKQGLRQLGQQLRTWNFSFFWYSILLIPPLFIFSVLQGLRFFISPAFTPNLFFIGITFGLIAGFFEEIGWTGFAFPLMQKKYGTYRAALILGLIWGIWHVSVVDALGAAVPHGNAWIFFFLAFIAMVTALRILLVWLYTHTKSILLTQLLHMSNTGFLVVFSPIHVLPLQEALWYAIYAGILWVIAGIVIKIDTAKKK